MVVLLESDVGEPVRGRPPTWKGVVQYLHKYSGKFHIRKARPSRDRRHRTWLQL